jgi:hypothetical protein
MICGMGAAQESFKTMLRERVAPALRELGFRGSGQRFVLPSATHWAILGFQRSSESDASRVSFTVNLTVVERAAWETRRVEHPWIGRHPSANVSYTAGPGREIPTYWHARIGELMPARDDHWWKLDSETEVAAAATEVISVIRDHGLPAMREQMI